MGLTKTMVGEVVYDGKKLWETYMGMGRAASYNKLEKWCKANGMVNPETGRVSRMGPFWAMWRYAFRNIDEAYPHWKLWAEEYLTELTANGYVINKDSFLEQIKEKVRNRKEIVSEKDYIEFCKKYNLTP